MWAASDLACHATGGAVGRLVTRVLVAVAVVAGLTAPAQAQAQALRPAASVAGELLAVSCPSGGNCWAVGIQNIDKFGNGTGFIEHWDGSGWQVVPSQNPPKSGSSALDGVACAQAASCWAVGYWSNAQGNATFPYAEHWNGQAWSEVAMPYPGHETLKTNLMRAVSCPATSQCWADGGYPGAKNGVVREHSLIERWTGRSWQIVPSPALPNSTTTDLQGLSCASARDCWATGDWLNQPSPLGPPIKGGALGYHWHGHQWTAVRIQDTRYNKAGDLYAASCPALLMCMATGSQAVDHGLKLRPYAERWNGSSWMAAPIGTVTSTNLTVSGVSCATAQVCMAVGWMRQTAGPTSTLAEQWNGSSWAAVPSPNPSGPGTIISTLSGVFCTQVTNCWAAGGWYSSTGPGSTTPETVLIEHWNGRAWTIAAS